MANEKQRQYTVNETVNTFHVVFHWTQSSNHGSIPLCKWHKTVTTKYNKPETSKKRKKSATCLHFYWTKDEWKKLQCYRFAIHAAFFLLVQSEVESERHRMDFITFEHLTFKMVWIRLSCFHFASMDFIVWNKHWNTCIYCFEKVTETKKKNFARNVMRFCQMDWKQVNSLWSLCRAKNNKDFKLFSI